MTIAASAPKIRYRSLKGYKYLLEHDFAIQTPVTHDGPYINSPNILVPYIRLSPSGYLTIRRGYAWDGASGPTIDTKSTMRASLVHDALYQLMREGLLPQSDRIKADQFFREMCLEDGMWGFRAWSWYHTLRMFAGYAAKPSKQKEVDKIQEAP